jgi:predicted RNase H-like HicB family nuclease
MLLDEVALSREESCTIGFVDDGMTHYIALIYKETAGPYGVFLHDMPGVTAAADTLDDELQEEGTVFGFAFEDWTSNRPSPRTLDDLRCDPEFLDWSSNAVVAAVVPENSTACTP